MADWVQCPSCGLKHAARPDGLCPRCQQPTAGGAGYGGGAYGGGQAPGATGFARAGPPPKVPSYLVQAILTTLCCCIPFGIVSIVYAAQVNSKLAGGDVSGALESSRSARNWAWIAFAVGLVTNVVYVLIKVANR
jgi:hypothetical protein